MKSLVLVSSIYGHTEVLAEAIARGSEEVGQTHLGKVGDFDPEELPDYDTIIWGCSGYFGQTNPPMAEFLSKLGGHWFNRRLEGKVGGVFATTSTTHGGLENVLRSLQTPMFHLGMVIVSNSGALTPQRLTYGCPYGAGAVIPVEESSTASMNTPSEYELDLAREYGRRVAQVGLALGQKTT